MFNAKENLVGLSASYLKLRSNAQNASNQTLLIHGSNGSYIGEENYGHIQAPTAEYAITGKGSLSAVLGKVYNAPYALSHIHVSTGAGQEPTVTADAVQVEAGATQSVCTYNTTPVAISPARHALTFGAFTYTESAALTLQTSEYDAAVNLAPATINGDPVASDSVEGVETVDITMWSSTELSSPEISVATGWKQNTDWTCTGADSSMYSWTTTLTKYLTAVEA
jgi:hypothetical protein